LKGNDLDYYVILPFMSTVVNNVKYVKKLTEDQILDRYDKIMSVIDYNILQGQKEETWIRYKGTVDGMLVSVVNVDCDFVRKNMAPKFKENPDDLKLAKNYG
jgi:hypothetical protein